MPRKKQEELTTALSPTSDPKPKRARKSSAEPTEAAQSQPTVKKATRARAVKAAPLPEMEPAPKVKPSRSKKAVAAAVEPPAPATVAPIKPRPRTKSASADAEAAEPEAKSKKTSRAAKKPEPAVEVFAGEDDLPIPVFRSRTAPGAKAPKTAEKPAPTRGRKSQPAPESPEPREEIEDAAFLVESDDLPIPLWRVRDASRVAKLKASATEDSATPARESRRRRGRQAKSEVEPPEQAAPQEEFDRSEDIPVEFRKREKKPLAPAPRPLIPTPAEAPQIVSRGGLPTLVRDGRVYPPMFFFGGSSDERSATTVLEELRMASEAGVHLHSHFIDLEIDESAVETNLKTAAYLLAKTCEVDRDAQVLFRLVFKAPRGWQQTFPKGRYLHEDGSLAEPSVCDDEFWNLAKTCLQQFVRGLRALPQGKQVLGIHLDRGEWFFADGWGYDTSDAATLKFREWSRVRYLDDEVMLRASWFDSDASFNNLQIPEYQPEGSEGDKFVRSSRKQRRYVDYHLFLSDATVHRIGDLAYAVKEASEGWFLVGASYGYTFEWSHPASGHLSLGKLLRTPEIDFIAGPPSYRNREPGGTAPFPGPIDSYGLNGKLYLSEEDFKTSLSGGREPDDFNPMIKTPQALESVHWRGAGAALAHGSGVSWMDLWGNGWLKTSSIWNRAGKVSQALIQRMNCNTCEPDVCVFIDERALAYLVDPNAFSLLVQNVREAVLRAGVNAGFYLLSDLAHREKFPEAKAYIFLNAWDLRPDLRAAIKGRLQRDGKVLFWLYSAGLFDSGRDSLERAREVTGIALKPQPFYSKSGTTILNRRHPLCEAFPDRSIASGAKLEPSYFAIPEEALVLGEYSQTGLPSFVVKEVDGGSPDLNWTSVFLGEPVVNPALIRALAQMSGAHIWNFTDDVVHVRPPFLTIHCAGAGPRTITLPSKWSAYNLLQRQWLQTENTNLRFQATDGSTHVLLVGTPEDVEAILASDPDELLRMSELPTRLDNTLAGDAASFDIPLMKLNEWMEGGDADEVADEWFLRPAPVEEEPVSEPEEQRPGRRRRKRRSRGGEETADFRPEFATDDDLGISVVFRRRE